MGILGSKIIHTSASIEHFTSWENRNKKHWRIHCDHIHTQQHSNRVQNHSHIHCGDWGRGEQSTYRCRWAPAGRNDGDGGDAPEQIEGHRSRRPCGQEGREGGRRNSRAGRRGAPVSFLRSPAHSRAGLKNRSVNRGPNRAGPVPVRSGPVRYSPNLNLKFEKKCWKNF
jgi:hypothetical protein